MSLLSEFRWFSEWIYSNDLALQVQIEDDKLIIFNELSVKHQYTLYDAIFCRQLIQSESANQIYYHARDVIRGQFELGEPVVALDPFFACRYAQDVLEGRFERGEPMIFSIEWSRDRYMESLSDLAKKQKQMKPVKQPLFPVIIWK